MQIFDGTVVLAEVIAGAKALMQECDAGTVKTPGWLEQSQ